MKKLRLFFSALALLLCSISISAHDFAVDGIYYQITSKTDLTVAVSYKGDYDNDYSNEYSGSVTIPESVTYNGNTYSVTSIGDDAFYFCSGLTSVTIGNSVTSIGSSAFSHCSGLTSVTIPNSVTSIGSYAFCLCDDLTSVTIPNSVTSIGEFAFSHCSGLTLIKVDNGNDKYDSRDNCNAIIETELNELIVGCKSTVIPNSVTSIGELAFDGCSGLASVTIPNSVTSIGVGAFYGCSGLTSVTIPNSVTSIGEYVFAYCSELTDVYCYAEQVPLTESSAFEVSYVEYATLHVPAESIGDYKAAAPWSGFGKIVALTEEETGIEDIAVEDLNINDAPVYNLQGMKMQNTDNLPKGIYIKGGKKYLVK